MISLGVFVPLNSTKGLYKAKIVNYQLTTYGIL